MVDGLKVEIPQSQQVVQDDAAALHAIKTAHGLVKSVHGKLPAHLQDPSIRATGRSQSGRPDWQERGHTLEEVRRVRGGRRGTREYFAGTAASLKLVRR